MTRKQVYEILKIVIAAIASIIALIFSQGCTMSMSISKYNSGSPQRVEHSSTVTADSSSVVIPIK